MSKFTIESNGARYDVQGNRMTILLRGQPQINIDLAPVIEGEKTKIDDWKNDNGLYSAQLTKGTTAFLQIRQGYLAYWVETDIPQIESLTYFPETTFNGQYWRTYLSDAYDGQMEKVVDVEVPISSAYDDVFHPDGRDSGGLTDPGDKPPLFIWNMASRSFSLKTEAAWFGFTIPGALPVGITRPKIKDQKFSLAFEVYRPICCQGKLAPVYFVGAAADPYDVLDAERVISDKLGLTIKKSPDHPAFWSVPGFKAYLEQSRLVREREIKGEQNVNFLDYISRDQLVDWVHTVKKDQQLDEMYTILEQGAYRYYGDYRPIEKLGGVEGFREMVDELRKENVHMCFYIHPFMFNTKIEFFKEHPEAFCKPKDKDHKTKYGCSHGDENPELALVDWTHPAGREYMLRQIEMLLSDKPGCMNCDWLRSNHWRSPDPRFYQFHDPDWGIGDLMSMKVQKLIYEKAKEIKPHACVSKVGFAAPWVQPYADVDLLSEEWNGSTNTWYTRSRIVTRLIKDMIFITDPYFLTITKISEYYMGMATWNILEDPIVKHAIHPYTCFRELGEKEFKRRRAGAKVQANAPINITDEIRVEPKHYNQATMWRKRTQGPLTGFYASMAFSKKCFATYSQTEARIAASENRTIEMPLPPNAKLKSVQMIPHDGKPKTWLAEQIQTADGPGLRLKITDCGYDAIYFRVKYDIKK